MDKTTSAQTPKPKVSGLSLKNIKNASRSRLSLGSPSAIWPWNKSSPPALTSASTLTNTGDKSPGWKYMSKRDDTPSKQSAETSDSPLNAPDRSSPKVGLSQSSADNLPSPDGAIENAKEVPNHDVQEAGTTDTPTPDTIPISDVALTVAIDCSGSTQGKVLEEEKSAIQSISKLLSQEAQDRMLILPWNDGADSALSLHEMDELFSSGGTDPTALLRDRHHRHALLNSSLWVLLTDGEIDDWLVRDFASSIGEAGLHGTAAIIICVGRANINPARCNISVGKSVFATVPDCMFVFHDIYSHNVYVLQCKGRFKSLMPGSDKTVILDDSTEWKDLPQIPYEALRDFAVPRKRNLSPDTVILTSGNTFNIKDVYNDILDPALANEILSNDDDLKTLLLTASTRGRKEEVKSWISKKKLRTTDPVWAPRKDIEHRAFKNIQKLVDASWNSTTSDVKALKKELRIAHEANWRNFANTISTEERRAKTRDIVIADATARLRLDDRAPASPVLMGPVSPSLNYGSENFTPASTFSPHIDIDNLYQPNPYSSRRRGQRPISPPPPNPNVLFSQGYKCRKTLDIVQPPPRPSLSEYHEGSCNLCRQSGQVMALILKRPEDEEPTANYPTAQQHAKHKFPFVLGNFPDVDIISPELYCETCSVYLVQLGKSPKAEGILGALPLVQTHGSGHGTNLQTWTDTLMNAFEGRFHEDIVISVFLSVLYNTLDDLTAIDSSENTHLTRAIKWVCRNISQSLRVCRDTNSIPLGESPPRQPGVSAPTTSSIPLAETIPSLVKDALYGHGPLLDYPLEGFLVLILAARDIDNENCERGSLRSVVWLRLIMHMTEAHYASTQDDGQKEAKNALIQILHTQDQEAKPGDSNHSTPLRKSPIALASLDGTYLLSNDDHETFQRMGNLFSHIGPKCGAAIAVYLHYLLEYSSMCSSAAECFDLIRKEKGLRKVFVAPEELNDGKAADLIARLHTTDRNIWK